MNISVALTTYNGKKYIKQQLESILCQMGLDDEIIICDDGSIDGTLEILEQYALNDKRINVIKNNHLGVVLNFEDAIRRCKNDVIFLSDHDDIWNTDKVENVKRRFNKKNTTLILHNALEYSEVKINSGKMLIPAMKHGVISNILSSCYWGCCMAFKKELVEHILPFPNMIVAHDQWIGIVAEARHEAEFIDLPLIKHRIHENNVTRKQGFIKKIGFRMNLFNGYLGYKKALMKKDAKK